MNETRHVNPRRYSYTRQKRLARAAMARRWEVASLNLERDAGRWLLGTDDAWRRWEAQECETGGQTG